MKGSNMKLLLTIVATLALALGISTSAQAQTSNVLLISQDTSTKVITVVRAADPGVTGTWLSYSSQLSTTATAIENRLFSAIPAGQVLLVKMDAYKNITVMLVNDPGVTGEFVVIDNSIIGAVSAIKNRLYLGL
jgi:hypothetical protein